MCVYMFIHENPIFTLFEGNMCKEVAWEGNSCEGGMQYTLCIREKCIGDSVLRKYVRYKCTCKGGKE